MHRGDHQSQKGTKEGGATSSQYVLPTSQTPLRWTPSWVKDAHTSTMKDLESDQMWAQTRQLVRDNPGDCPPYQRSKPPLLGTAHSEPAQVFLYRFFASNKHFMCFTVFAEYFFKEVKDQGPASSCFVPGNQEGPPSSYIGFVSSTSRLFSFYNPSLFHNFSFSAFYPSLPFNLGKLHSLESGGGDGVGGLI